MINGYVHVIAVLAVCSRVADVWTTYLVSPEPSKHHDEVKAK
jgi:hypothetical protein